MKMKVLRKDIALGHPVVHHFRICYMWPMAKYHRTPWIRVLNYITHFSKAYIRINPSRKVAVGFEILKWAWYAIISSTH